VNKDFCFILKKDRSKPLSCFSQTTEVCMASNKIYATEILSFLPAVFSISTRAGSAYSKN
jgi:hypothetical protein